MAARKHRGFWSHTGGVLTSRNVAIFLGLSLLFIPTLWQLFPTLGSIWWGWRAGALVFWVVAAITAVVATTDQSRQVSELLRTPRARRADQRRLAADRLMLALFPPRDGPLSGYDFRLFLPNEDRAHLVSSFGSSGGGAVEWEYGKGATGKAWEDERYVIARGEQCSDGTFGVAEHERARYERLNVVAAMPVWNARSQPIGVLTASSERDDDQVDEPEWIDELSELATTVARILIDVSRDARD